MKKHYSGFKQHDSVAAIFIIFFCLLFVSLNAQPGPNEKDKYDTRCEKDCRHGAWLPPPYSEIPKDTTIILWKKPNISTAIFELWKKNHKIPEGNKKEPCPFCGDAGLELYEGVSLELFGGTGGTSTCTSVTPPCKPSGGGDDTVEYSYNIPVQLVHPFIMKEGKYQKEDTPMVFHPYIPAQDNFKGTVVNVAVFDTGVDTAVTNKYTTALPGACENSAAKGWNYAYGNKDTRDDYPGMHGTRVAKFIIDEVQQYQHQKVNIIPVKIFDSTGHTSLYKILCGFIYAQKSGIQIINASFGFYWHDLNNRPPLLPDFVKTYLTDHKIILVAAAGNRDTAEDNAVLKWNLVSPADLRNLDRHPVYPAALAGQPGFENVIAVTTLFRPEDKVSPQQNFSSRIVDVGVNGEYIFNVNLPMPDEEFGFKDPLAPSVSGQTHVISGSSYATPIVTGKIVAFYSQLIGTGPVLNKANFLSALQTHGLIDHSTGPGLGAQVRNGTYSKK